MSLTRRLFTRRAPIAAAVLPSALHQTAQNFGPGAPPIPPLMTGAVSPGQTDVVAERKWHAFDLLRRESEETRWQREHQVNLLGGLDPDLFALRSMPVTQKARIQAERNRAREKSRQSLMKTLAEKCGVPWHG